MEAEKSIEFGFAEARTVHKASQRLLEANGFTPVGFEPMKYMVTGRECFVVYAKLYGHATKLRNSRVLLIPEVYDLATNAIRGMGLIEDIGVDPYAGRYPVDHSLTMEAIDEMFMPRLLKIELGRVVMPEIFGSLHLNYGYFKIKSKNAHYLIAKKDDEAVGAIGYTLDPVDKKMKIFELVAEDEFVKGYLLNEIVRFSDENGMVYMEADVSAYSPRMQKTFYDLGFRPIAYMPAMVFQDIERLDIVRFARITCPMIMDNVVLTEKAKDVYSLVQKAMGEKQ